MYKLSSDTIRLSAVDAIRKARENEHKVYICTGRSKAEVYPNLWEIGLDGMIGGNGSYVEDHGKVVMHQLITKEQCIHVVDWLHARGLEFYLESNSGLFASEKFEEVGEPAVRLYSSRKGKDGAQQLRVRDAFPDLQNGTWGGAGELAIFGDLGVKGITKAHAADYVTADVDEDGLYKAFVYLGLID